MQSDRYSCQILMKPTIFDIFSKNLQIANFMKIRPVTAELFHAGGMTALTKLIFAFRNFSKATKIVDDLREGKLQKAGES